jgi:Ca-activated chloride channel homolog
MAALLMAASAASPQAPPRPSFAVSVENVYLDVFVVRDGAPVANLQASDFEVRDQGVRQDVRLAQHQDLPLTAVLVFDASASLRGPRLEHLQTASRALVAGLRDRDEAALVGFSHELSVLVPQGAHRSAVRQAIDAIAAGGATAMWDGLYAGLKLPRARGRVLVVLFTDGEDNMSWLSPAQVQRVAEESNAVVYVVTIDDPVRNVRGSDLPSQKALRRIADVTGGQLWEAGSSKDLEPTFLRILAEMQSAYLLTYEPTGVKAEGWHRIEVKVKGGRGKVRTRGGYFIPPPARP